VPNRLIPGTMEKKGEGGLTADKDCSVRSRGKQRAKITGHRIRPEGADPRKHIQEKKRSVTRPAVIEGGVTLRSQANRLQRERWGEGEAAERGTLSVSMVMLSALILQTAVRDMCPSPLPAGAPRW